ncbi:MAG: tetratricopeptide repeat protein [Pyrinomonadaceae bacterium]|nr:tetratricopeptide repeat protein [Pyrinomonadaceae bacterium]
MNAPEKQIYRFENVEVNLQHCSLRRGEQEQHLRRKTFQVLVYLLEQRERLVTKNELMENVWKDTAVTDDALVQCIKEIRRTLGDNSQQPRFIKTVPKVGYRFISPVEENFNDAAQIKEIIHMESKREIDFSPAAAPLSQIASQLPEIASGATLPKWKTQCAATMIISLIVMIIVGLSVSFAPNLWQSAAPPSEISLPQTPGKKPIAVMYFENQSGSAELEWLREGLADMLITNLSRSGKLTVLSRRQLHLLLERYGYRQGENIGFDAVLATARKSRAEWFITGSFAQIGEKVRIDLQLHDTATGELRAAENLTVERAELILTEIDLLSLKIINHLGAAENDSPAQLTRVMTNNLEAYRYYSLAVEKAQAMHNREAIELLEKAIALDADFAMAHARIGYTYALSWGFAEKGKPHLERAFRLSERLTEKDRLSIAAWYAIANLDYPNAIQAFREIINRYPFETEAYWRLARLQSGEERLAEALETLKQGLAVDPEAKDIYNALGGTLSAMGRHDEARAAHERYVALAPVEPNAYDSLGLTYQWAGDYAAAIENYNRALELNPTFEIAIVHLANTRFQLGQYSAAIDLYRRYIAAAKSDGERERGFDCIAYVYLKKRDFDSAEKALNEGRKIKKEPTCISFIIAFERGDAVKTAELEEFFSAKMLDTDRGARTKQRFDFHLRGLAALKNGLTDKAVANFKEVVRRPPPIWNIDAHEDCLADAYLQTGRFDEAAAEYERILHLNPRYPLAHFHLAQIFERQGKIEKAHDFYQQFLELWNEADADIPEIRDAKRFLSALDR